MIILADLLLIFIGVAGGIAVGSGFVAFIAVLDIVPRLTQLTKSGQFIHVYEYAIVAGVLFFSWMDFRDWTLHLSTVVVMAVGVVMGMFVGMLAAALTEVMNVFPILVKRLHMQVHLLYLLMAMALGKVIGSLYQWLIFQVW